MKYKTKNYLQLGVLLLAIIGFLTNCENDDSIKPLIHNNSPYKLTITSYSNLIQVPKFTNAIDEVIINKQKTNNFGKTVMENQYGFSIDSTTVKEITLENKVSYTLLIHREIEDASFFENLVITIDNNNETSAVIVKYILNSEGIYNFEDDSYSLDAQIEVTSITYDNSQFKIGDCIGILICPWGENHTAGQKCIDADRDGENAIYLDTSICEGGGSGLGGNDSGGISTNPNGETSGSSSSGGDGGVFTSPVGTPTPKNPCEKLNEITDNPNIRNKFKTLKEHSNTNSEKEKGFKTLKDPSNNNLYDHPIQTGVFNGSDYKLKIKANPNTLMVVHTHPKNDAFEFFSSEDIMYFASMASANVTDTGIAILNPTEITFALTVNDQTFALQFDDTETVQKLIDIYQDKEKRNYFIKILRGDYEDDINIMTGETTDIDKQRHHVFNHFEKYNLNVSLYKANYNGGYIQDWEKLNENGSTTPCN